MSITEVLSQEDLQFGMKLAEVANHVGRYKSRATNEQKAKDYLIAPLLRALGYHPSNPDHVEPEFTAKTAVGQGEKADYALLHDGQPVILMEFKGGGAKLDVKHAAALVSYFDRTPSAKFAVLTDGLKYVVFSDFDEKQRMDREPFWEFDIENLMQEDERGLQYLSRQNYNESHAVDFFTSQMQSDRVRDYVRTMFTNPPDEFVAAVIRYCGESADQATIRQHRQRIKELLHEETQRRAEQMANGIALAKINAYKEGRKSLRLGELIQLFANGQTPSGNPSRPR